MGRLEVGRVVKPHGLRGEVVVALVSNRPERLAPGETLETDRGPLLVLASRPHTDRWLVFFEGVHDREAAERLRGVVLEAEPLEDGEALWVHELIGATVVTRDGVERGAVAAVEDNPAHDLLVLDDGSLVPIVFVAGWDDQRRVVIDAPDGLFDG